MEEQEKEVYVVKSFFRLLVGVCWVLLDAIVFLFFLNVFCGRLILGLVLVFQVGISSRPPSEIGICRE